MDNIYQKLTIRYNDEEDFDNHLMKNKRTVHRTENCF